MSFQLEENLLVANGCLRRSLMQKEKWRNTKLVEKGYSQVEGIDYGEIFSPVAKLTSIRFILSIVVAFYLEVEQMDVKTTFLHGDPEE